MITVKCVTNLDLSLVDVLGKVGYDDLVGRLLSWFDGGGDFGFGDRTGHSATDNLLLSSRLAAAALADGATRTGLDNLNKEKEGALRRRGDSRLRNGAHFFESFVHCKFRKRKRRE